MIPDLPQPVAIAPHRIHPLTKPGYVLLQVAELDTQLEFYQRVLGFQVKGRHQADIRLGSLGQDLVRLTQLPGGRRYRAVTGLYHFAVLFPNRRELARAIARLLEHHWPNAPTDHVMTKTSYLEDPEGNTIELDCESPEDGIFSVDAQGN